MKKFIIGKEISLHGLRSKDLSEDSPYFNWLDDLSLDIYTERSYFPNNLKSYRSYYEHTCENSDILLLGIYDNQSGKHIGNISFQHINWINRNASINYMLGDKEFTGKGITTQACLMLMYYGFNKLNFERIWAGVSEAHLASQRVLQKVGLVEEGKKRKHILRQGNYYDVIMMGAIREEWIEKFGDLARSCFRNPKEIFPE